MPDLPKEKTKIQPDFYTYEWLLYGEPKVGKTAVTSCIPGVLHISTDPIQGGLEYHVVKVNKWADFLDVIKKLETEDHPFIRFVIDRVDGLYDMAFRKVCKSLGIDHPSEEAYGKGWDAVSKELQEGLNRIRALGTTWFLCAAKVNEIETRSGNKKRKLGPWLSGGFSAWLTGQVDQIAYMGYAEDSGPAIEQGERIIVLSGDDTIVAGGRLLKTNFHLKGTNQPLVGIKAGNSHEEAFDSLLIAWENEYDVDISIPKINVAKKFVNKKKEK